MKMDEAINESALRLAFVRRGDSWADVRRRFEHFSHAGLPLQPMVELLAAITDWSLAEQLFPGNSMANLVVSDTPDFQSVSGVLHVGYDAERHLFVFHHLGWDGRQEYRQCAEAQAFQVFARFSQEIFQLADDLPACEQELAQAAAL